MARLPDSPKPPGTQIPSHPPEIPGSGLRTRLAALNENLGPGLITGASDDNPSEDSMVANASMGLRALTRRRRVVKCGAHGHLAAGVVVHYVP